MPLFETEITQMPQVKLKSMKNTLLTKSTNHFTYALSSFNH